MRRSLPYEILATLGALVGAFVLVCIYFPLLNPGAYKIQSGQTGEPLSYYLIATPFPLLILAASWYLNRKAQRLKREEKSKNDDAA